MYSSTLTKIIIALVVILAISVAGLIAVSVMQREPEDTKPIGTVAPPSTTVADGTSEEEPSSSGEVTDPEQTTAGDEPVFPPVSTDTPVNPPVTNPPVTEPPTTDVPPVNPPTTDPVQKAPAGYTLSKTFKSNSGTKYLNTVIEVSGKANTDGTVHLTVNMYLEHWAIGVGKRNCSITVGSAFKEFTSQSISSDNNSPQKTLLTTLETDVIYGQSLALVANFPFNGTYGTTDVKVINITDVITVK
ncbi:MAG: hypothetical protein KBT31_03750 [Firmicutes bacterium]|nr:hypothetical protein [Candidatus Colimorpha enterica]